MSKKYIQYGCGLSAPKEWINYDASPTLRIQKTPFLSSLLKRVLNASFPKNVKYGDIVKGLPEEDNSCDGIYCSHVLEHLSYEDFIRALNNTYVILKPGGIFRLVMPDLEIIINSYITNKIKGNKEASVKFIRSTLMGTNSRSKGVRSIIESSFGNANHLWLWDKDSTILELEKLGFKNIRVCKYDDSKDEMFKFVENSDRFKGALALEMIK